MNPIKNQGMFLETLLNITHQKYIDNNECVVSKISTNIIPISTKNNQITNAKFYNSINCDYIDIYKDYILNLKQKKHIRNILIFT